MIKTVRKCFIGNIINYILLYAYADKVQAQETKIQKNIDKKICRQYKAKQKQIARDTHQLVDNLTASGTFKQLDALKNFRDSAEDQNSEAKYSFNPI